MIQASVRENLAKRVLQLDPGMKAVTEYLLSLPAVNYETASSAMKGASKEAKAEILTKTIFMSALRMAYNYAAAFGVPISEIFNTIMEKMIVKYKQKEEIKPTCNMIIARIAENYMENYYSAKYLVSFARYGAVFGAVLSKVLDEECYLPRKIDDAICIIEDVCDKHGLSPAPFYTICSAEKKKERLHSESELYEINTNETNEISFERLHISDVSNCLNILSDREKRIINLRILEDRTLSDIGKRENITQSRVKQIEEKAMRKIRKAYCG